jgi:hypothetical protein
MKNLSLARIVLLSVFLTLTGCAGGWMGGSLVTLIDADKGLENWNRVGDANWRAEGGVIVADNGKGGFLVSKDSYKDFVIYAEFWAATDTNSGIFIRASDPAKIAADNSYEVNIWDIRPDPTYATASIVNFAPVPVPTLYKAGGKWNTLEVTARGNEMSVKFNGVTTVMLRDGKYASGPFALQYGAGVQGATGGAIKWRKVQITSL